MRKIFKFLFVSILLCNVGSALAQTENTLYSIGFIGGQKSIPQGTTTNTYSYSTGHVGSTPNYVTIVPNESLVVTGFPINVLYFKNVFDKPLFASKGYFAEYVQLQWNVVNLANSIKRFKVYRKALGDPGDSLLVGTIPADNNSWKDEFAERGVIYQYTLFAEGLSDKLRLPYVNILQGIGFAMPTGRASGRIAFEGGTAVEGVSVLAETNGSLSGKSLYLNGTSSYFSVPHLASDKELEIRTGFTFQAWCKKTSSGNQVIFSKGNQYDLSMNDSQISFKVNDATLVLPFVQPTDTFFHVTAVYNPTGNLSLYVHISEDRVDSAKTASGTQPIAAVDNIIFGKNNSGNYFQGYLDEMRLWNTPLAYTDIKGNFSRYINGTESNLIGYWRLNEGIGNQFYDFARKGFTFYENHAFIYNGSWTSVTPERSQLAFKGVTDASGNYTISGFPYETDGSLYKFTPTFGAHQFDPNQQIRLISDGTSIINELNFKDISSFAVSGTVRYKNTNFPVEGVSILVDGKPATNKDGQLVLTDNLGRFALSVAIGKHSIKLQLNGHTFENEGRFPVAQPGNPIPTHNFEKPVAGIEFLDATLVRVAGRVVGGPVESAKLLGFGLSKNNIGNATINLTTEKGYDISLSDSTKNYTEEHITSSANFNIKNVKIYPDVTTGEYVAYLLPEKYKVTGITAGTGPGTYIFDANYNVTINLKSVVGQSEILHDTLAAKVKGISLPYPPYNASKYDTITTSIAGDTTWTIGVDTFNFQQRQDFIYRVTPTIVVANKNGVELFGDESFEYENKVLGVKETIPLIKNGSYVFGHPVFNDRATYSMFIDLFEEYTNSNTGTISKVPVIDGRLEITNELAIESEKKSVDLNSKGKALYEFKGGLPEINKDALNPGNSYTRIINITAFSGNNESIKTIWRDGDPLRGFLFGGMPVGSNFVTTGPTQVITILRDPPGSSSKAYLEKGEGKANITKWEVENTFKQEGEATIKLGQSKKVFAGVGVGTITEFEYASDRTLGWESEEKWVSDNEKTTKVTTTKKWETSESSDYVGDQADVFVGYATSIVYGQSSIIDLLPSSACTTCIPTSYAGTTGGYSIGLKEGLRLNPEISTGFMHTQGHIEEVILPNLKKLRNSFLVYSANPSSIAPNVVTSPSDEECTNKAIYVSLIPLTNAKYGSSNTDTIIWGNLAAKSNADRSKGPSYKIISATGCDAYYTKDTIAYFNQQIKDWVYWLARNEEQKVNAKQEVENLAFDAGAVFEKSVQTEIEETSNQSFAYSINPSLAAKTGFEIDEFGVELSLKLSYGHVETDGTGTGTTDATTYGYVLSESESTDYYSVNVRKPTDGFGPVFRINGGVSSCPYQGATQTKYYLEGGKPVVLSPATVPVDAPGLDVEQAIASDVASNRAAQYTLLLKNNSGISADRWYTLTIDDASNPYGAAIEIDGAPIANGRTFLVKAGEILSKTLKVRMGRPDVMDYEDLRLILSSQCDDDINDDVLISAYFIPGCSDITLEVPKENWVMNTNNTPKDSLLVKISAYDQTYNNFKQVLFQYKPSGSSLWTTDMIFYNPKSVTQAEYDAAQEPKQWISGPSILYYWDMHSQPDRNYDLRAKSICVLGPGLNLETPTDIISGIKDVKRPLVFGSPQPADGVVSSGDEISVQFDETIEASLLTPFNFSVQAVLNGYQINHNTSVDFDGVNDEVKMNDGLNLNKSFTIEFWAKRNEISKRQTVFSKGSIGTDLIEIGFNTGNQLFVKLGQQEITTSKVFTDTDWFHYAVSYDASTKKISAYRNDVFILENVVVASAFSGIGAITLGRSIIGGTDPYKGNLHELRIWNKALQMGDVYSKMSSSLSGNEIGIVGYWPFDEANGKLGHDKARFRHATINAQWLVLPKGKGYAFDGVDDYLKLNTGSTVIISEEMDFTVEFWFKGAAGQTNKTLFSSGKGDGTDNYNAGSWSIGVNSLGQLQVQSNGIYLVMESAPTILNDNWHHFAVSVNRKGNTNVFVDGELVKSQTSVGFGPLYGVDMWLGARGYKTGSLTTLFDQYFNGSIDEFRVWTLSKKQNQVGLAKDSKLTGDELGLVAYYPFEHYVTSLGIKSIEPSLDDQWNNPYGSNGGTAVAMGGAVYSDLTPNIKDARPLQKVDFDWVVNDDKIIITPSPSMAAAIEKTLLEITVSGIEDKYENRVASPVTWTAFVDKNQLKWGDDQISLEKVLYQPLQFTVDIVNKGGTQQNFTINNLPSWLKASPQSGIISALSSIQVTFTVDEGLNTGTYQEDIYLKSDFGFDEKFIVSLRNFTPIPSNWTVDPDKFQYSMNIDGQIKMNGIISSNPFDHLAVFVGTECRGVAQLQYVEAFDNYQAFLTIYSNSIGGEKLDFKFWNADEGQVYTKVTPDFTFTANGVQGTPSAPIIFESKDNLLENRVSLPKGWKWISFNLYSNDMKKVNNIVKITGSDGDQIKGKLYYDSYDLTKGWIGSLSSNGGLKNQEMYKAYMNSAKEFTYSGKFPDVDTLPISLVAGWNWIGYISRINMKVNEALASLNPTAGDIIKGQHNFATYEPSMGWIGNLTYLKPGDGYMYKAQAAGTLVYPKISQLNNKTLAEAEETDSHTWNFNPYKFSDNMNIIASVELGNGVSVSEEDLLGAFVDGDCRGLVKPTYNPITKKYNFFLTVNGDANTSNVRFRYYNNSEDKEYTANENLTYQSNSLKGENTSPFPITVDGLSSTGVALYPNPFTREIGINVRLAQDSHVKMSITDLTGRKVKAFEDKDASAGIINLKWDGLDQSGTSVTSGVYLLQVIINGELSTYKIVKY